ncbi:MAG: 5-carboxymethyl-2-hydroxymuconate isomerase, partial [Pseudomonadota bacterium]
MRLVTYTLDNETRLGAQKGDGIVDLNAADSALPADMLSLLQGGDDLMAKASAVVAAAEPTIALADVTLESPIPNPPRIFAIGLN